MKIIANFEFYQKTTLCDCKVQVKVIKKLFRKSYMLGEFYNLTSGYVVSNSKKFRNDNELVTWVEDVTKRIERGEL